MQQPLGAADVMGFSKIFDNSIRQKSSHLRGFESLLEPMDDAALQKLAARSAAATRRHFGRTMRLFAPLYLSNECINSCAYCGFSRENAIQRVTLEIDQVEREARHLVEEGFRNILLVAGEHPKFVSGPYIEMCLERLRSFVPSLSIEVAPMETPDYTPLVAAGAEGLIVYQETYHRETYARMHLAGPKKDFDWRLDCPERGHEAGFRRIGIGALFGLTDWKFEALALAAHLEYLQRVCWKSQLTVSLPRLRPAAGEFEPENPLPDREFIQLLCALRVTFPAVGIVLSTREPAALRDLIAPLGITMMSAGSHTEPGGYTGQGKDALHLTVRGKIQPGTGGDAATEQFSISDDRDARTVEGVLQKLGLDPVWKDWDAEILGGTR
jgi:2-iminoacetate synthase